jgi:NADH dehydrogenase
MQNLVTVFGGSGFIGGQTVRRLAKAGWRVRVAVRQPNLAHAMRLHGDVGQIDIVQANIRIADSVARALEGATAAVNLVGVLHEQGNQGFEAVHVAGARHVAEAARAAGVERLVQMSALGANAASASKYARTKALGEQAVRQAFPSAVVIRPSVVFGPDDHFFNKFAQMALMSPALPLIGGGATRFQPVYVDDLARAIARACDLPEAAGQTYELGGPADFSFRELMVLMLQVIERRRILAPIPFGIAEILGRFGDLAGLFVTPPVTSDQVRMLRSDNVVSADRPGLAELGVSASTLEAVIPSYLYRYRKGGQYADQEDRALAGIAQ